MSLLIGIGGGGWIGRKFTESRAIRAETSLRELKDTQDLQQKHYDKMVSIYQSQIATIEKTSNESLAKSTQDFEDYKQTQEKNLAEKDAVIATLSKQVSSRENNISKLKSDLGAAKDATERAQIQARIAAEQKEVDASKIRLQGLGCLSVPVPKEYLDNLNKVQ